MRLALTDPLTGLGNHRHFHERLQRELPDAESTQPPLTLCLVDIDDFKKINDRFGHPAGDRVLSPGRGAAAAGRRGVPARRRRVRAPARRATTRRRRWPRRASIVERIARARPRPHRLGHRERRRRDVPRAGRRTRRADPARGQRALLGEGARQEPRARLPARTSSSSPSCKRLASRPRPRGALPRRRVAREGGRRARRLHRQPLGARRRARRPHRRAARARPTSRSS